jgi:hypothetical protein
MSRRKIVSAAFTGVAAAGAVGIAAQGAFAPAAFASTGWHVINNAGTAISKNTHYTAKNTSSPATLATNGVTLTCPKSTAIESGSFLKSPVATSSRNDQVGTVSVANFGAGKTCTFGSNTFSATLAAGHTLKLIAGKYKSSAHKIVSGKLTGAISENVAGSTLLGICAMTVSGTSVPASYNNGTHRLTFNPNDVSTLTVKANTCPLVAAGKPAKLKVKYAITAPASLSKATLEMSKGTLEIP